VKLDKTETRMMTIIKQAGIITCGVFAISLHAKQPGIQSTRLVEISEILLVCDTNFHGQAQVALQIAFQIACFIPAYWTEFTYFYKLNIKGNFHVKFQISSTFLSKNNLEVKFKIFFLSISCCFRVFWPF